jgi:hypothetical protein
MPRLSAHEMSLSKIFSSDYQFVIPDYQRPYSWGQEQAIQLLNDLKDALERNVDDEPYFLGSVVLVKKETDAVAEVIDGQQRLTTLTILLSVLRSLTEDPGFRSSFDTMLEEPGNAIQELTAQPRLTLRPRDKAFFRKFVQAGNLTELFEQPDGALKDAQRNIRDNTRALHDELARWDESEREALSRLVSNRTYLVVVATPSLESAHRIFNVLNSRGLDLSAADIFKSRVVGSLSDELSPEYATRWEDAEDALGRAKFLELFLHIRVIFAKTRGQRELLVEFPQQVLNKFLPERATEFVDDVLIPYADALGIVDRANYTWPHGAERVNLWLRRLGTIDNADWKPAALWLVHHLGGEPEALASHLRVFERIAAVMLIRRTYATPRATRYANLIKNLEGGMDLDSPEYQIDDMERREALLQLHGPIYQSAPLRKFVLTRLNDAMSSGGATYDHKIITVEHVLPQNPKEASDWNAKFSESAAKYWVHKLGNLVLLDKRKNAEAQNYDFEEKKEKYFRSPSGVPPFALTVDVIDSESWTPETLETRQSRLVRVLAKTWGLETSEEGDDLAALTETQLLALSPSNLESEATSGKRVAIADLVNAGLVGVGTELSWDRPRLGQNFKATIVENGELRLSDGRTFATPSRAAKEAAGVDTQDGWEAWKLPDGRTLAQLWRDHRDLTAKESVSEEANHE